MKIEGSDVMFSSGTRASANGGIIGLSPELELFGGYDGRLYNEDCDVDDINLSTADKIELAEYMIGQWTKFKAALVSGEEACAKEGK